MNKIFYSHKMTAIKKQETRYLENKESIRQLLSKFHWSDIMRHMIESLDSIDDVNTSQSIEIFKIVSSLEDAIISYNRIQNVSKN